MNLGSELELLKSAQLIRAAQDAEYTYLFHSPLGQQAAYESLLTKSRRDLHRRVAQIYEELYAGQLDKLAALLAHHYAEAGDEAKVFEYSSHAGHAALRVYATAEAISNFTLAIKAASRLDLHPPAPDAAEESALTRCYLQRGRAYEMTGRFQEALGNYEEMETFADAHGDPQMKLGALVALATIHSTTTSIADPVHARLLSNLALNLARDIGGRRTEARVLWNLMLLSIFLGEMPQAVEYGEQSLAISRELGMPEQTALTLNDLGRPYLSLGQSDRARASLQEALGLFRETDNQPMIVDCLTRFGAANFAIGRLDQVLESAHAAQKTSEAIGNLWGQSFSRLFVGPIYFSRGEISRAYATMRDCIRLAEQAGFMIPLVQVRSVLATLCGALGDVRQGLELARQAHAIAVNRLPGFESAACAALARLYVWEGDLVQAEENLRRGVATKTEDFALLHFDQLGVAGTEIALAQNDYARAITTADEALAWIAKRGFHIFRSELLYLKALSLRRLGTEEAARRALLESKEEAERLGSRWMQWKIYAAMGERDRAYALVEQVARDTPEELRASFLNLPSVRLLQATAGAD